MFLGLASASMEGGHLFTDDFETNFIPWLQMADRINDFFKKSARALGIYYLIIIFTNTVKLINQHSFDLISTR
jgi:hypothetical protein